MFKGSLKRFSFPLPGRGDTFKERMVQIKAAAAEISMADLQKSKIH